MAVVIESSGAEIAIYLSLGQMIGIRLASLCRVSSSIINNQDNIQNFPDSHPFRKISPLWAETGGIEISRDNIANQNITAMNDENTTPAHNNNLVAVSHDDKPVASSIPSVSSLAAAIVP
jgi:hypothetical protein